MTNKIPIVKKVYRYWLDILDSVSMKSYSNVDTDEMMIPITIFISGKYGRLNILIAIGKMKE